MGSTLLFGSVCFGGTTSFGTTWHYMDSMWCHLVILYQLGLHGQPRFSNNCFVRHVFAKRFLTELRGDKSVCFLFGIHWNILSFTRCIPWMHAPTHFHLSPPFVKVLLFAWHLSSSGESSALHACQGLKLSLSGGSSACFLCNYRQHLQF